MSLREGFLGIPFGRLERSKGCSGIVIRHLYRLKSQFIGIQAKKTNNKNTLKLKSAGIQLGHSEFATSRRVLKEKKHLLSIYYVPGNTCIVNVT